MILPKITFPGSSKKEASTQPSTPIPQVSVSPGAAPAVSTTALPQIQIPVTSAPPLQQTDRNRFAPPQQMTPVSTPAVVPTESAPASPSKLVKDIPLQASEPVADTSVSPAEEQPVVHAHSVRDVKFADIWMTPENISYIRDVKTKCGLIPIETDDLREFKSVLEQNYTGSSSYALNFKGENYRIERIMTTTGVQYNCRKMPTETPDIFSLGLPQPVVKQLVSLSQEAGLILIGGPTGMGKTTTLSALLRQYLEKDGGFLYTVEDPPEMPLNGVYHARNGALGLCKQTPVENERWEDGLKSALRSRPRYILVGEVRTPETASQALRAATSGHLVLTTIHANSVEDALNSMIKYAAGAGLPEMLVLDLLARSILAVVHQKLEGTTVLHPVIQSAFANPDLGVGDQMRSTIREGKISLGTLMEAQATKLLQGKPLFKSY